MANFVSTTTPAYSDPLKALSIKALEDRLKAQQVQAAQQQSDAASMATIPGGIGSVLGIVGDRMQQARSEQAVAAQKQELAKVMSGYDPASGAPPPASIAQFAPDMYKDMMQVWAENRRNKETTDASRYSSDQSSGATRYSSDNTLKGTQGTNATTTAGNQLRADVDREQQSNQAAIETAKLDAAKAAAVEKARVDAQAKTDEEYRISQRPQDDAAKIGLDLKNGLITQEVADARLRKLSANSPSEEKLLIEERNKAVEYQSTLKELDKAHELINSPKGIHSGNAITTPLKTGIGSVIPQSLGGPDDETQANTKQFNLIMKSQGLQNLLAMKGASSDKDVELNLGIANDPSQTLERRKDALNIVRNKLYTHVKANEEDIARISGKYPTLQAAPGGADKNAAAKAWLADPANKSNPDFEAVRRKVEGK